LVEKLIKGIEPHPLTQGDALQQFRNILLTWGNLNFKPFPWRLTHDPYAILMAEIMLHRTQAKQVIPVYLAFIEKFPDLRSIHETDEDNLNESLKALGLHWRIELIKKMAEDIFNQFGAAIPQEKVLLMSLPGINDYIASAVRCFSWNYPDPLIDTNTVRIVGRLFGEITKDSSRRNRGIRSLIENLIDPQEPALFNYALLDLAHLVCHKKVKPECPICPIRQYCMHVQAINTDLDK